MTEAVRSTEGVSPMALAFGLVAFGAYFLVGSYYAFTHAKWPPFMLIQLDVIGVLLGLISSQAAGYVGSGLLGLLGLGFVALGIVVLVKHKHQDVVEERR